MLLCVWGLVEQTTKTPSAGGVGHLLGQHHLLWQSFSRHSPPKWRPPQSANNTTVSPDLSLGLALLWTHYLNSIMRKNWRVGLSPEDLRKIPAFMFCCLLTAYNTGQPRDLSHRLYRTWCGPGCSRASVSRRSQGPAAGVVPRTRASRAWGRQQSPGASSVPCRRQWCSQLHGIWLLLENNVHSL